MEGLDWQGRVIRIWVNISDVAKIAPEGIRLLLSHTASAWVPVDWSAWIVPKTSLTGGEWITLTFDLATAPSLVFGSGANLSQVRFIGLQSIDAGSGSVVLKWDDLRTVP